jgi:hypothetical protein
MGKKSKKRPSRINGPPSRAVDEDEEQQPEVEIEIGVGPHDDGLDDDDASELY